MLLTHIKPAAQTSSILLQSFGEYAATNENCIELLIEFVISAGKESQADCYNLWISAIQRQQNLHDDIIVPP